MALLPLPDGYAPLSDGYAPVLFPKERCVACFKSKERGNEQPFVVSSVLYDGAVYRPPLQFITYN